MFFEPQCYPSSPPATGGIEWSYHRFGNASAGKPPLVMIHGLGGTQYDWPMSVRRLWGGGPISGEEHCTWHAGADASGTTLLVRGATV